MIKRFLIAIVLLALLAGGLVGFNMFRTQAIEDFFANMPAQTLTVTAVTVEPTSWTPAIEAIGTVSANRGVDLTVETTGIIREMKFSANDRVEEGQILLQMDDAVQQADLVATRAQAELDRQSLERAQELRQRGVGSAVTLQAAEAAAAASAAQVQKLEAVLQQKQLRAPFAGTLGIPRVDVGQYLSPGVAVITLQDLDTMRADFTVPEQQLSQLGIGQKVALTIDGDDTVFSGEITGIDPKIDPSSRLVAVRAAIDNSENRLTPGRFVRVDVELPQENNIIVVPQTAVITSLYGDHVYVVRPKEDDKEKLEARQVFVGVGRRSGQNVEIRTGLAAGDVVITSGQNRLNNGSLVAVDNTIDPAKGLGQEADAK